MAGPFFILNSDTLFETVSSKQYRNSILITKENRFVQVCVGKKRGQPKIALRLPSYTKSLFEVSRYATGAPQSNSCGLA